MIGREIEEKVEAIALDLLNRQTESRTSGQLEFVDAEYVQEHNEQYLRVYIDKPSGVGLDDCEEFSRRLEEVLDHDDMIKTGYILEVSSPGLDRVLKKERDFVRECGKKVDLTLYAPLNGEKIITGVLQGFDGANVILSEERVIPKDKIAQVRLHIDF